MGLQFGGMDGIHPLVWVIVAEMALIAVLALVIGGRGDR